MDEVLSIRKFIVYMEFENAKKNILCEKKPTLLVVKQYTNEIYFKLKIKSWKYWNWKRYENVRKVIRYLYPKLVYKGYTSCVFLLKENICLNIVLATKIYG